MILRGTLDCLGMAMSLSVATVYGIEVCEFTSLQTCRFDREDAWVPLAEWLSGGEAH
jgi:hypothetical protein